MTYILLALLIASHAAVLVHAESPVQIIFDTDKSVVICSVGALSNLEDLINSGGDDFSSLNGTELIQQKVRRTVIMGGEIKGRPDRLASIIDDLMTTKP